MDILDQTDDGIVVNFDRIKAFLDTGIRRAAVFASLGARPVEGDVPTDAGIAPLLRFKVIPRPLTAEESAAFRDEYAAWILGNALKELDLAWHLFLDRLWTALELSSQGHLVDTELTPTSVEKMTNSARKLSKLMDALGNTDPDQDHFETIANARNVLTHQSGVVTPDKAFHGGRLKLSWRGLHTEVVGPDGSVTPWSGAEPIIVFGEAKLRTAFVERSRMFEVGERIALSLPEIAGLCLFY